MRRKRQCEVTELPSKKKGRPLLLGEKLDQQVKTYLHALRSSGAVVNTAIALARAQGIVVIVRMPTCLLAMVDTSP